MMERLREHNRLSQEDRLEKPASPRAPRATIESQGPLLSAETPNAGEPMAVTGYIRELEHRCADTRDHALRKLRSYREMPTWTIAGKPLARCNSPTGLTFSHTKRRGGSSAGDTTVVAAPSQAEAPSAAIQQPTSHPDWSQCISCVKTYLLMQTCKLQIFAADCNNNYHRFCYRNTILSE